MTSIEQANSLYAAKPSNDLQDPRSKATLSFPIATRKHGGPLHVSRRTARRCAKAGKAETAEVTAQISSQKNCRVIRISKWPLIKTGR